MTTWQEEALGVSTEQLNGHHSVDNVDVLEELRKEQEEKRRSEAMTNDDGFFVGDTFEPSAPTWLWYPYLPVGSLVSAEGASDLGKSLTWIDIAVALANGDKLPDGTKLDKPVGVVYITAEEVKFDEVIVPRMYKAGATKETMGRIALVGYQRKPYLRPIDFTRKEDIAVLEKAIDRVQAKLVIADPVTSMLGKVNINQSAEVRRGLAPVVELAGRKGVAFVNIRHHRKGNEGGFKERGIGSSAFLEVPRVAIAYMKDSTDTTGDTRLFIHFIHNLTEQNKPLKYKLSGEKRGVAKVIWEGESDLTEEEILSGATNKGELWQTLELLINVDEHCQELDDLIRLVEDTHEKKYTEANIKVTLGNMVNAKVIARSKRGVYCKQRTQAEWNEYNKRTAKR